MAADGPMSAHSGVVSSPRGGLTLSTLSGGSCAELALVTRRKIVAIRTTWSQPVAGVAFSKYLASLRVRPSLPRATSTR